MPAPTWRVRGGVVPLARPVVLGIVNVTPDSFSDGGKFFSADAAVEHARRLVDEGADLLDVGGESTRPQGATAVTADEEQRRILPVVRALRHAWPDVPVSVDTSKAVVAAAALDAGAAVVNDVSGLRIDPAMARTCAAAGAGVVIMHSRGDVSDMATYAHAQYGPDPTGEIIGELTQRIDIALAAGVPRSSIAIDPGIGFAKRSEHSLGVLAELSRVVALGYPVMVGVSRKRFIGEITGVTAAAERVDGSIGAAVAALARGARLFRVHDVRAAREALDVAWAILSATPGAAGPGATAGFPEE